MTCSVCGPRSQTRGRNTEISGTWDYKWPLGTSIRVAFQTPTDKKDLEDFEHIRRRIAELARRWEVKTFSYIEEHKPGVTANEFLTTGIRLDFSRDRIFDKPLGPAAPAGSSNRSPFFESDLDDNEYDVLVSLERLPLTRRDPLRVTAESRVEDGEKGDPAEQTILLPFSELGSYARRVDYGLPTIFLGNPRKKGSLLEHLMTAAGAHSVVHEFGHVLGIAHMHQAPQYSDAIYRSPSEIAQILKQGFSIDADVPLQFVREHIIMRWPGSEVFSDWRVPRSITTLSSVMAHPSILNLFRDGIGPTAQLSAKEVGRRLNAGLDALDRDAAKLVAAALGGPDKPAALEALAYELNDPEQKRVEAFLEQYRGSTTDADPVLVDPTDIDIEQLLLMYGPPRVRARWSKRPLSKLEKRAKVVAAKATQS